MTWATEKPTKEGWYWWRANGKEDSIVRVTITEEGGPIIQFETGYTTYLSKVDGQFSGPLEPPQ